MDDMQQTNTIPVGEAIFLEDIFSLQQWQELTSLVNDIALQPAILEKVAYGKGGLENKKFSLSLYKFISRQNNISQPNDSVYTATLLNILHHSFLMSKINALNNKRMEILRLQLNLMTKDGHVTCHADYESDNAYLCSVLIRIGQDYTGGNLVLYDENNTPKYINQADRTVLAISSRTKHAVETVKSGVRYTICLFCG